LCVELPRLLKIDLIIVVLWQLSKMDTF